jgi:hypothetical protein
MSDDTEQASEGGTGAPTTGLGGMSVPLGVHVDAVRAAIRDGDLRWLHERDRRISEHFAHIRDLRISQREADQSAIEKALAAQQQLAEKHNDLIRAGEKKDETYATKDDLAHVQGLLVQNIARLEKWQARLTGIALAVSVLGVANFVKLWTG